MIKVNWWLDALNEEEFEEVYEGTNLTNLSWLFKFEPNSDQEYFESFFTSKICRLNAGIYSVGTRRFQMDKEDHLAYAELLKAGMLLSTDKEPSILSLLIDIDSWLGGLSEEIKVKAKSRTEAVHKLNAIYDIVDSIPDKVLEIIGRRDLKIEVTISYEKIS